MFSPSHSARIAALAALIASTGDLLLLYIGNSQRAEFALPQIGEGWLWLGGMLGACAIPFYALGYRAVSEWIAPLSRRAAQALFVSGIIGSLLGAVIHALTAAYIGASLHRGVVSEDPLKAILQSGPLLLSLWGLAALLILFASVLFLWYVGSGRTAAPRALALANPAFLTLALGAAGSPSILLRAFLTPAAPNLAHVIFFILCSHWLDQRGRSL
ncbi:MAG: DUF6796 family protein [Chloroflexota bacterium]